MERSKTRRELALGPTRPKSSQCDFDRRNTGHYKAKGSVRCVSILVFVYDSCSWRRKVSRSLEFELGNFLLISHPRPSFHFTARATLPVGAGLGSSASFSVCAATAVLLLHQRLSIPPLPEPARDPGSRAPNDPGHVHISHQGRRAIPSEFAEEVNRWAFISEKILHGNPSGVDNSVSVFGGALAYTRPGFGKKSGMYPIQGSVHISKVA
jgi:mevalonate kinase